MSTAQKRQTLHQRKLILSMRDNKEKEIDTYNYL